MVSAPGSSEFPTGKHRKMVGPWSQEDDARIRRTRKGINFLLQNLQIS